MRYQIILSNTKETITIREDELEMVLKGIHLGTPVIVREGIFNPSYFVAIIPDYRRMEHIAEARRGKYDPEEPAPFEHLLKKKLNLLPAQSKKDKRS